MNTPSPGGVTQLLQAWRGGEQSAFDERKARVAEMRLCRGLSVEQTTKVLVVSPQILLRNWKLAKVWLLREMKRGEAAPPRGEPSP